MYVAYVARVFHARLRVVSDSNDSFDCHYYNFNRILARKFTDELQELRHVVSHQSFWGSPSFVGIFRRHDVDVAWH